MRLSLSERQRKIYHNVKDSEWEETKERYYEKERDNGHHLKWWAKNMKTRKPRDMSNARKKMRRTAPEKAMIEILTELGIEFEIEFPLRFLDGYKIYDFRIDKLLIEVDGDYIHGNFDNDSVSFNYMQMKNKKNDGQKNWIAKKSGYKIIRFWQSTIERDKQLVIERLKKAINADKK